MQFLDLYCLLISDQNINFHIFFTYFNESMIQNEENNDHLAYWLSNTSCLLFLLQKSLKAAGGVGTASRKKPPPTSLFGRMAQVRHLL